MRKPKGMRELSPMRITKRSFQLYSSQQRKRRSAKAQKSPPWKRPVHETSSPFPLIAR